jgi:hypothetical protein
VEIGTSVGSNNDNVATLKDDLDDGLRSTSDGREDEKQPAGGKAKQLDGGRMKAAAIVVEGDSQ